MKFHVIRMEGDDLGDRFWTTSKCVKAEVLPHNANLKKKNPNNEQQNPRLITLERN